MRPESTYSIIHMAFIEPSYKCLFESYPLNAKTLWLGSNVVAPIHKVVVTLTSQRQNYVALTLSQHWIVSLKSQQEI